MPPARHAPEDLQAPVAAAQDYRAAEDWLAQLVALETHAPLADWVPQSGFAVSAYRLSLLGLIGDAGSEQRSGVGAELSRLPLRWRVGTGLDTVGRAGVASMSRGVLLPEGVDPPDDLVHLRPPPSASGDAEPDDVRAAASSDGDAVSSSPSQATRPRTRRRRVPDTTA